MKKRIGVFCLFLLALLVCQGAWAQTHLLEDIPFGISYEDFIRRMEKNGTEMMPEPKVDSETGEEVLALRSVGAYQQQYNGGASLEAIFDAERRLVELVLVGVGLDESVSGVTYTIPPQADQVDNWMANTIRDYYYGVTQDFGKPDGGTVRPGDVYEDLFWDTRIDERGIRKILEREGWIEGAVYFDNVVFRFFAERVEEYTYYYLLNVHYYAEAPQMEKEQ